MDSGVRIVRLYADAAGESHFEDTVVPLRTVDFAPPAPPVELSEFTATSQTGFLRAPAGWFGDWHPAPARQYMSILAGTVEVGVRDGEVRRAGPGDVMLLEDTHGKGHATRVIDGPILVLVVQL